MRNFFLLLVMFILLTGCATTGSVRSSDLASYGFVAGRFPAVAKTLHFRNLETGKITDVTLKKIGTAQVVRFEEGTYYISHIEGMSMGLLASTNYFFETPVELCAPIVVKKGVVTYIGTLAFENGGFLHKDSATFSTSIAGVTAELAQNYPALVNTKIESLYE